MKPTVFFNNCPGYAALVYCEQQVPLKSYGWVFAMAVSAVNWSEKFIC